MVNKIKQKLVAIAELQMLFQFALKTMIWNEGFQFIKNMTDLIMHRNC